MGRTPADVEGDRAELVALLARLSFQRRPVLLASGRASDFYIDGKQTTLNARGAWLVGSLVADEILAANGPISGVGGLTLGADPIATAASLACLQRGHPVHAFLVRKEPKSHGTSRWVEGRANLPDGAPVCIVEDTATTGGSALRAIARAEEDGLRVVQVITLVDREEGARDALAAAGHPLTALVRRQDIEAFLDR